MTAHGLIWRGRTEVEKEVMETVQGFTDPRDRSGFVTISVHKKGQWSYFSLYGDKKDVLEHIGWMMMNDNYDEEPAALMLNLYEERDSAVKAVLAKYFSQLEL